MLQSFFFCIVNDFNNFKTEVHHCRETQIIKNRGR